MDRLLQKRLFIQRLKLGLAIASVVIFGSCAVLGPYSKARFEFNQGLALFNRGQYGEAIRHFEKATEIDPDFARAYLYLGRSYLNLGRWRDAIPPLRTALRLSPNGFEKEVVPILVDALLGAAISEFKKDNFQGSIGFLKEGLALEPQSDRLKGELFQALLALGVKLLSEERSGEAIAAFSEAVKLFPTDYRAYLGLARAFLQNQDFHMAMKAIRHALTVDPANMEAQDLLQELLTQ